MKRRNILKAVAAVLAGLSAKTVAVASNEYTPSKDVKMFDALEAIYLMRYKFVVKCVGVEGYFVFAKGFNETDRLGYYPDGKISLGRLTHVSENGNYGEIKFGMLENFSRDKGKIFCLANIEYNESKAENKTMPEKSDVFGYND